MSWSQVDIGHLQQHAINNVKSIRTVTISNCWLVDLITFDVIHILHTHMAIPQALHIDRFITTLTSKARRYFAENLQLKLSALTWLRYESCHWYMIPKLKSKLLGKPKIYTGDKTSLYRRYSDIVTFHDNVIKWKHFPRYCPLVRVIHRLRWIPLTKASDAELWCFLWSAPVQTLITVMVTFNIVCRPGRRTVWHNCSTWR